MNCPLCRSTKTRTAFRGINPDQPHLERVPVIRCLRCGLAFSDHSAIPQSMDLIHHGPVTASRFKDRVRNFILKVFQSEKVHLALGSKKDGSVLDINLGDKTFVQMLPPAWKHENFKLDEIQVDQIKDRFLGTRFDVITLWRSFEKVETPRLFLRQMYRLLKDDGQLFLSVANFDGLQSQLFGPRWTHLDPSRNVFHYSPEVISRILNESGFEVVRIRTLSLEGGVLGWWQSLMNLFPFGYNLAVQWMANPWSQKSVPKWLLWLYRILALPLAVLCQPLAVFESLVGRGGILYVTAKKKPFFEIQPRFNKMRTLEPSRERGLPPPPPTI